MIAERRPGSVSWVAVMRMLVNPLASSRVSVLGGGEGACGAAGLLFGFGSLCGVEAVVGDDVADAEPAARAEHPERFGQHAGLVGGQVDHAVGDDDIDVPVGQRDVLDVAVQELRVADTGLGGVLAGQGDHVRGAVQPIGLAAGGDAAGGQQHVDPAAGTEVQHGFSWAQLSDGDGIAAAEAGPQCTLGQFAGVVVSGGAEAAGREGAGVAVGDLLPGARGLR